MIHAKIQKEIPKATQIKENDSMDKFEKILPANNIAIPNKDNKINFVFFIQKPLSVSVKILCRKILQLSQKLREKGLFLSQNLHIQN